MTINFDRKTLRSIARRTLGRSEDDTRPISSVYAAHLKHFLTAFPNEQDFSIDLDSGKGSVYCWLCERKLSPGDGEPEEDGKDIYGSMTNLAVHVNSTAHRNRKAGITPNSVQLPIPSSSSTMDITLGHGMPSSSRQVINLDESSMIPGQSSSVSLTGTLDMDEDYLLALKLDEELNGPRQSETGEAPINIDEPLVNAVVEETQDEVPFPFEETYHAQIQGILSNAPEENPTSYKLYRESHDIIQIRCLVCHYSIAMPGAGSFEAALVDVMQGVAAFEEHFKSPYHIRKRTEAHTSSQGSEATSYETHAQVSPSTLPQVSPQVVQDTGKRKLPVSWYEDRISDEPELANHLRPAEDGFTLASSLLRAPANLPGLSDSDHRPIPVLGEMENPYPEGTALHVARNIAVRRFQESRAAALDMYGSYRGMNAGDFNINYDDAGPVSRIDQGGSDLDKRFQDFMNRALEEFREVQTVTDAQKKLKMLTESDLLPGMQAYLLPHQIIGVAWMVDQEKDEDKLGGILADAMGLGKTVQAIATMVYNRPPRRKPEVDFFERRQGEKGKGKDVGCMRRATLVLAPASLLQQWYEELDDKVAPDVFRVHIHHGKDKLKTVKEIEEYDVIIASHQSVVTDFPKEKKGDRPGQHDDDDDSLEEDFPVANRKTLGPLARVQWLRVIIDEAQSIRNRSTRISTCVTKLDSRYRWCLTGTPITNTLADIYGFMRFCRFAPWNDWKLFNEKIARVQRKNPRRAGEKVQAILKPHLLRRTKDSKLDGRPIIRLGPRTVDMIELDFTPEEQEMYKAVEASQKKIVSRFMKEGTVMKNYSFILVMILRLRQLCCHPKLATTEANSDQIDAEGLTKELSRAEQVMSPSKVKEVKERFKSRIARRMMVELGLVEAEEDDCAICMEPFVENGRVTICAHEFCSDCINEVLQVARGRSIDEVARCPLCRAVLSEKDIFVGKIFEPSAEELDELIRKLPKPSDDASGSEPPSKKLKVDAAMVDNVAGSGEDFDFNRKGKDKAEPSTKMRCMLDTIMHWMEECPGDKIILYSQWTSMLDLVEGYLKDYGIEVLRYDGRMNRLARVESVARFKKPTGPSVMLVSLKCGGVGLNLTVANRVINLDLAWNYATEAQAYDRVHRLGQQKPVEIHRLIIRGTIEERIIRLQAKKQGLSDAALGEGTGNKLQRLTARDIAQLFDL